MDPFDKLTPDLTWQADGHVTEVALTLLADGERSLLEARAVEHVEGCGACSTRLGECALISLRVGEELPGMLAAPVAAAAVLSARPARKSPIPAALVAASRPLPLRAIAAALLVAAIGALPTFIAGTSRLPELLAIAMRALAMMLRTSMAIVQGSAAGAGGIPAALSFLSAGLLVTAGLAVARSMSRRRVLQGGV